MRALLPALLAAAGTTVLVGLPTSRRTAVLGRRTRRQVALPPIVLPVVVAGALLVPLGAVGALVAAGLSVVGRQALAARKAAEARAAERASAAEAMVVLAAELRAGRSPEEALRRALAVANGPVAEALAAGVTAAAYGGAVEEALLRPIERSAVPEVLRGLAACWSVCRGMGTGLAVSVDRLEEALRADRETRQEVDAELAGPRSSALLLSCLPAFGLLLGAVLGAHPLNTLLRTPVGNGCLVAGVSLDLLGLWWTARIARRASGEAFS